MVEERCFSLNKVCDLVRVFDEHGTTKSLILKWVLGFFQEVTKNMRSLSSWRYIKGRIFKLESRVL